MISYAGTEFNTQSTPGKVNDFINANMPLSLGKDSPQAHESALLYEEVQTRFGTGANISFTGHSLGGGLAGLMAVWFDRPAIVFDPAPFESAATVDSGMANTIGAVRDDFSKRQIVDPKFRDYVPSRDFAAREAQVQSYAIDGEVLQVSSLLKPFSRIEASRKPKLQGAAPDLSSEDKHSVDLLAAVLLNNDFEVAVKAIPNVLPVLFDPKLYGYIALGSRQNLLVKLVRGEVGVYDEVDGTQNTAPTALLTKFTTDIEQVGGSGTITLTPMQKAVLAAAMDYYYVSEAAKATKFFSTVNGVLNFDLGDIGAPVSSLKSPGKLANAVWAIAGADGVVAENAARSITSWHIQSGTDPMTWSGGGADDAAIGGTSADTLFGGDGNDLLLGLAGADSLLGGTGTDILLGGEGADTLDGGAGPDYLYGGAGFDEYNFSGTFGGDWIVDSDGQGVIKFEGLALAGGKLIATGSSTYKDLASGWSYTRAESDLIIWKDAVVNKITVRNWTDGQLGITLADSVNPAPVAATVITGDTAKAVSDGKYTLGTTGYASAGLQAGAADILIGTDESETLLGLGGNDGISAGSGDDLVEGGAGSDLLFGGLGADTLNGGAGDDFIFGSAVGAINRPTAVDFKAPALTSGRIEAARGFSWLAERAAGDRWKNDTATFLGIAINGADASPNFYGPGGDIYIENTGNVIDAGEGNDYVAAGTGADIVHGGAGDDDLYGLNGADVLYGDAGSDFIKGDGISTVGSNVYTPDDSHGDDILVGGAGNDVLMGQGGNDELYGGADNDWLYGDDTKVDDTPMAIHGNDYLDGGEGDDQLTGGGKDDTLYGGTGNDLLWGDSNRLADVAGEYQGKDYLDGEEGDDQLTGGGNDDTLYGGAGNDLLWGDDRQGIVPPGYQGRDYLDGEEGSDQLVGGGNADTLFGGEGNDVMLGDDDMARVEASLHGDDYLDGEGGDDSLYGGGGNDELYGGDGKDYLNGDDDKSRLGYAAHGNDTLDGGAGDDELVGGGGNDQLIGGAGNDVLQGDDVNGQVDILAHGNDTLDGGEGNDTLFGGGAADQLFGGNGDDQLYGDGALEDIPASAHGNDLLDGGEGNDLLFGGGGQDTLLGGAGSDSLLGGIGSDTLDGGDADDYLDGGDGNDYLDGGAGFDALFGGAGDDIIVSDGQDYLDGGEGNDTYYISTAPTGIVGSYNDAAGSNTVYVNGIDLSKSRAFVQNGTAYVSTGASNLISLGNEASLAGMVLKTDEADAGTSALEIVNRTSANGLVRSGRWDGSSVTNTREIATAQTIVGTERADWLEGGAGIDALTGGGGADMIDGGAGADVIYGGTGGDTIRGGRGGDTLWAANASGGNDAEQDMFAFARGDGGDYIRFSALSAGGAKDVIRFDAGISRSDISVSAVLSTDGADARPQLTISYGGSDRISFEVGAEGTIEGLQFADGTSMSMAEVLALCTASSGGAVVVTESDDYLIGTALGDNLRGRGGNDTLIGAGGDDVLQGNDGQNVYQFSGASGKDLILPMAGEHATLAFLDVDPAVATVRIEGDNLVIRTGVATSVQIVGFRQLADAPKNWLVQFATGEPITVEALLRANAMPDPAVSGDRRDRFLAQQRVELQTLPQRVFESGGAVPVALTQTSLSVDADGTLALPDSLSRSTQTFTAVHRYK